MAKDSDIVYVVLITSKTIGESPKVGAVYKTMLKALAECRRLEKANPYTKAMAVHREVE